MHTAIPEHVKAFVEFLDYDDLSAYAEYQKDATDSLCYGDGACFIALIEGEYWMIDFDVSESIAGVVDECKFLGRSMDLYVDAAMVGDGVDFDLVVAEIRNNLRGVNVIASSLYSFGHKNESMYECFRYTIEGAIADAVDCVSEV